MPVGGAFLTLTHRHKAGHARASGGTGSSYTAPNLPTGSGRNTGLRGLTCHPLLQGPGPRRKKLGLSGPTLPQTLLVGPRQHKATCFQS